MFTHARAYEFNRGRNPHTCLSILEDDGSLCPSAAKPGVTLSDDQIRRALAAFGDPSPDSPTAPWCFDPHHGIVLYDAEEKPVGGMSICFECDRKGRWPKLPGREFDTPSIGPRALSAFRALFCDELGMKPCGEE